MCLSLPYTDYLAFNSSITTMQGIWSDEKRILIAWSESERDKEKEREKYGTYFSIKEHTIKNYWCNSVSMNKDNH